MTPVPRASWLLRHEGWLLWLLGAAAFAAVPVALGGLGIGWDALNHHFYLGWVADAPRFGRDLFTAGYQSFQWPYLYWPLYRLAAAGVDGVTAGVALATLQSLAIPPVWLVALRLMPGAAASDAAFRALAVVLAFLGGLTLSLLDSTPNDLLAAIPFLAAVALAFESWHRTRGAPGAGSQRLLLLSGALAGVAVACKLSNRPIALALPLVWMLGGRGAAQALQRIALAGTAAVAGFLLAYGYWGWLLWQHFGNPIFPFYDDLFEPARNALGWRR